MTLFKMTHEIYAPIATAIAVYLSFGDAIEAFRLAILMVSFAYYAFKLWDYLVKRRNKKK